MADPNETTETSSPNTKAALQAELASATSRATALAAELAASTARADTLATERDSLAADRDRADAQIHEQGRRIAELEGRLTAAAARIDELEGQPLAESADPRDVMFGRLVGALEAQALLALAAASPHPASHAAPRALRQRAAELLGATA